MKFSGPVLCDAEPAFMLPAFEREGAKNEARKVTIAFKSVDPSMLSTIFATDVFNSWADQYCNNPTMLLESVTICGVEKEEGEIKSINIEYKVVVDDKTLTKSATLNETPMSILVLLRNTLTKKKYVLLESTSNTNVGDPSYLKLPTMKFSPSKQLKGPFADEMSAIVGIKIFDADLVELTSHVITKHSKGISTNPDNAFERNRLFLYRQTITTDEYDRLIEAIKGREGECSVKLRLTSLDSAWSTVSDARTLASLFLANECINQPKLLSHAERRGKSRWMVKRKAEFLQVSNLDPNANGVNLAVILVAAPTETETVKRDGAKAREGICTVGDASGVVKFKLSYEQIDTLGDVGQKLVIRNARIEVVKGHVYLVVDRWGKICKDEETLSEHNFDFTPNASHDVSAIEYERVIIDNKEGKEDIPDSGNSSRRNTGGGGSRRENYNKSPPKRRGGGSGAGVPNRGHNQQRYH